MPREYRTEGLYDRTWLEKARRAAGLKQYQVAELAHVSQGFYNRIESGVQIPNVKIGLAITNAVGVSPNAWIDEKQIA